MAEDERERKPDTTNLPFHDGYTSSAPVTHPAPGSYLHAHTDHPDTPQPALFTQLKIRDVIFKNRIIVSPMCQYSAASGTGMPSNYHLAHLGAFAMRGSALVMTEATSVLPNGVISPEDLGIWSDEHIEPFRRIVDFIHSQGALAGIQLAHAGRKANGQAPWEKGSKGAYVPEEADRWKTNWAPSAIPFSKDETAPHEMTLEDIESLKAAYRAGAQRAVKAGFDIVESHNAHGYLLASFLSPQSNHRTDKYGGSLENRMRLNIEIAEILRSVWPDTKPVFVRISATEWHPQGEKNPDGTWLSWGIEQSITLAKELKNTGVDLMDVSSGGNLTNQVIDRKPSYQVPFADAIKKAVPDLLISSVGIILTGTQANDIIQSGKADTIMLGRELLSNADFVFDAAKELKSVVKIPVQYERAFSRRY